jgi:hypothetical protein
MGDKHKIKVGDMAKVVWTDDCGIPPVVGLVIKVVHNGGMDYEPPQYDRPRALMFCQGSPTWFDAGDLELVSKS